MEKFRYFAKTHPPPSDKIIKLVPLPPRSAPFENFHGGRGEGEEKFMTFPRRSSLLPLSRPTSDNWNILSFAGIEEGEHRKGRKVSLVRL